MVTTSLLAVSLKNLPRSNFLILFKLMFNLILLWIVKTILKLRRTMLTFVDILYDLILDVDFFDIFLEESRNICRRLIFFTVFNHSKEYDLSMLDLV
jgi:hypothetical protein